MTFEQVRDLIVDTLACEPEEVKPETTLTEDLAADSLAVVELMMALEEATGVTIPDQDAATLKTVGDIVSYLNAHKA